MPENNFDQSGQSMACFKQTNEKLALYSSDFSIFKEIYQNKNMLWETDLSY